MKKGHIATLLIFLVLLIDQALKFYIKTNFEYNEEVLMFGQEWARLHFVENEGMAFGITFDWAYGKLLLSLFRIILVGGLIYWMRALIAAKMPNGFVMSVALITAGALGNIIDSAVYGLIFSASPYHGGLAEMVPFGTGYGTFLHGKVVDMLYFPMHYFEMPEWLGGGNFLFFSPIFNIADAAITVGVLNILIFQRHFFKESPEEQPASTTTEEIAETIDQQAELEQVEGDPELPVDETTDITESDAAADAPEIDPAPTPGADKDLSAPQL